MGICGDGPINPRALRWANDPEPKEAQVETTNVSVYAARALTPNQLAVHLEAMAELIEANDSDRGKAGPAKACWGCGKRTPAAEKGGHKMACKVPGWVTIRRKRMTETWCPECAAIPGFGCVEEVE